MMEKEQVARVWNVIQDKETSYKRLRCGHEVVND